jgi:phage gpG-like protein
VRVQLTARGFGVAAAHLEGVGSRAASPVGALRDVATVLRAGERTRFASGRGWRRLDPDTRSRKSRMNLPAQRLVGTGRLRRSLTERGGENIETVRPTELRFGTRVPYARYHQTGLGGVPRRRLVMVSREQRTRIHFILRDYIVEPRARARR